jgi:hypothetical protein
MSGGLHDDDSGMVARGELPAAPISTRPGGMMDIRRTLHFLAAVAMGLASLTAAGASLTGSIQNNQGAPICGLVLANGQFTFSCSPNGSYSLQNVPLDAAGQITLFGFADGHFPFKAVLPGSTTAHNITLNLASSPAPVENNLTRTERLVGGTWTLIYTIISTFSPRYSFSSVTASTATPGDYVAAGSDEFGSLVIGTYASQLGQWAILDPGTTIDRFFVFTFLDDNRVSGCYHQISPAGSTNLSGCYSMNGSRFPPKSGGAPPIDMRDEEALEAFQAPSPVEADAGTLDAYLRARRTLERK